MLTNKDFVHIIQWFQTHDCCLKENRFVWTRFYFSVSMLLVFNVDLGTEILWSLVCHRMLCNGTSGQM